MELPLRRLERFLQGRVVRVGGLQHLEPALELAADILGRQGGSPLLLVGRSGPEPRGIVHLDDRGQL
ncbi:MAG TPA: hypothetical protein VEZ71_06625, partial [Archangium sp.]|nr:hypothetical protein [Archangium sp.]